MSHHQLVILANSIKHGGHCVAGKLVNGSRWVRPVADEQGGALSRNQILCQNPHGRFQVKPLQKVTIGLKQQVPLINQPENYLIDDSSWQQNYKIEKAELVRYLDTPNDLWGTTDRVSLGAIQEGLLRITQSLYLVKVSNLRLYVNQHNKRRANFSYQQVVYDLAVTDPNFDTLVTTQSEICGIVCLSLASEFKGYYYKVVATLF